MFKTIAIAAVLGAGFAVPATSGLAANSPDYLVNACRSSLDGMRTIVRKETVRALGPGTRVSVIPFCMGVQFNDFGNAAGLGKTIGANKVLAAALSRSGWRADDVTSIAINGNYVRLYVHRD